MSTAAGGSDQFVRTRAGIRFFVLEDDPEVVALARRAALKGHAARGGASARN